MELNENSWYARMYKWIYGVELPNNLCKLFWSLLLMIPFFILSLPVQILQRVLAATVLKEFYESNRDNGAMLAFNAVLSIPPALCLIAERNVTNWLAIFAMEAVVIILAVFGFGVFVLFDKLPAVKFNGNNIFKQRVKDFKNKTCTIIKWNNDSKRESKRVD